MTTTMWVELALGVGSVVAWWLSLKGMERTLRRYTAEYEKLRAKIEALQDAE